MVYDVSGERWGEFKSGLVNLCVNLHGDPLLSAIRELAVGDCVIVFQPVLGEWLDTEIEPAIQAKIQADNARSEEWSIGLALFTFSPIDLPGRPPEAAPDRLTPDICRSMPQLRQALMRAADDDGEAKAILATCLGHHFSDTKNRLIVVELKQLHPKTWWKIEQAMHKVLAQAEEDLKSEELHVRAHAQAVLSSDQALCEAILPHIRSTGITRWQRVQEYIDVFGHGDDLPLIDLAIARDDEQEMLDLLIDLERCLYATDGPNALSWGEREAIIRQYFDGGIPKGLSSADFTRKYGCSRPVHNSRVKSGVEKLSRCLGRKPGGAQ